MTTMTARARWVALSLGLAIVSAGGLAALAQDPASETEQAAGEALDTRRASQEQLDAWAAERADLKRRWDVADAQVAYLAERAALERERLAALEAAGNELARRLEESQRLESSLEDTLLVILRNLEAAIAADLPFLPEERTRRVASVRRELGDPAADSADKLRRVLEAVLVEARYGGALEVYQDRIEVAGEELTCELVHVGRLGLFWLTPDLTRGGAWDPAASAFVEMSGSDLDQIRRAAEVATRRRPAGVLALPLGRVAP
jgi:hypothetical protein